MQQLDLMREFSDLCYSTIQRDGLKELMKWVADSDFSTAPASTRFHGNYEGGLLEHSLNVYHALKQLVSLHNIPVSEESITIVALFHDLCKANYYTESTRNVKDEDTGKWIKVPYYTVNDQFPVGHGEKSIIILQGFIKLTDEEVYAIRWHMGGFDSAVKGGDYGLSKAYELCPLAVLLHLADMTATYLMEARV